MTALDGSAGPDVAAQVVDQLAGELAALDARELELQGEIAAVREAGKRMRTALRALDPEHERAHPPGHTPGPAKPTAKKSSAYLVRPATLAIVWTWVQEHADGPFPISQAIADFEALPDGDRVESSGVRKAFDELRDAGALRLAGQMRADTPGARAARAFRVSDVAAGDRYVSDRRDAS